jgi:starch synthase
VEYYGSIGFLKAGLYCADRIGTVSPSYAAEIATRAGGMGLGGLIAARRGDLHGILNGIDTNVWNPARDPLLPAGFDADDMAGRTACRAALARAFGLDAPEDAPLYAMVGRLPGQKGVDLLLGALPTLLATGGRLALLGSGDSALEAGLLAAAAAHPDRIGVRIGYDETLAHLLQAGADLLIVPSRFEPCGLTQLCALRYGAVPLVARTGGLADTIVDANPVAIAAGCATGLQCAPGDTDSLEAAIVRAGGLFRDRETWQRIRANAMATDVSWAGSAAVYADLYRTMLAAHRG